MPDDGFEIEFSPDLTPEQIKVATEALCDFYRACGGLGFNIEVLAQ